MAEYEGEKKTLPDIARGSKRAAEVAPEGGKHSLPPAEKTHGIHRCPDEPHNKAMAPQYKGQ